MSAVEGQSAFPVARSSVGLARLGRLALAILCCRSCPKPNTGLRRKAAHAFKSRGSDHRLRGFAIVFYGAGNGIGSIARPLGTDSEILIALIRLQY
jgi:hypothetical protein